MLDKVVYKVDLFNNFCRFRVPDDTLTNEEWALLFAVYDSPQQKLLKNVVEERSAAILGIDTHIENNRESLFKSVDARKVEIILMFNAHLGFPFSLHESNCSKDVSAECLVRMYDVMASKFTDIDVLFRSDYRVTANGSSDHGKARIMASFVHSAYSKWIGFSFSLSSSVRQRSSGSRVRVCTYSLSSPRKQSGRFHDAITDGILHKYLSLSGVTYKHSTSKPIAASEQ